MSLKSKKGKVSFKKGDKLVLLSMTSSTPLQPSLIFTHTGRLLSDKRLLTAEAISPEGNVISVMRTDSCFIKAHVVRFIGDDTFPLGEFQNISKGTLLTVQFETAEDFMCFETGIYPIPKSLCEEVFLL